MLVIFTAELIVQFPRPWLLNVTLSFVPGTLKPPAPPETFDQLAGLFQLDDELAIQKRFAAEALKDWVRASPITNKGKTNFMNIEFGRGGILANVKKYIICQHHQCEEQDSKGWAIIPEVPHGTK